MFVFLTSASSDSESFDVSTLTQRSFHESERVTSVYDHVGVVSCVGVVLSRPRPRDRGGCAAALRSQDDLMGAADQTHMFVLIALPVEGRSCGRCAATAPEQEDSGAM